MSESAVLTSLQSLLVAALYAPATVSFALAVFTHEFPHNLRCILPDVICVASIVEVPFYFMYVQDTVIYNSIGLNAKKGT